MSTDAAAIATADPVAHLVPNSACPSKIAVDGADRVWFLYRPCGAPDGIGGLGVYDPSTDRFDLAPAVAGQIADLAHVNVLRNNPRSPNIIVVASNSDTSTVDVSTGTVNADSAHPDGATDVAVTSDGTRYLRGDDDLTSMPVGDPGSATDRVLYDSVSMNESRWAQRVALSADDQYLAGAFGTDIVSFGTAGSGHSWVRRCETVHNDVEAMVWVGATVWFLQDWPANLALQHCDGMTTPQSLIEGPNVSSARAGTSLRTQFTLAYGDLPVAGATISIQRAGSATAVDLVTDAQGHAGFVAAVRRGSNDFLLSYAGDDTRPPYAASWVVKGTAEPSTFLPPPDHLTGRVDRTLAIHNRLLAASGTGLGGRTLHVVRADASGRHRLRDITTDRTGRFTLSDVPRYGPTDTYYVSYAGEPGYLPARTAKFAVAVARLRPDLRIGLRAKAIWYDQSATVRIHLGRTYNRRSVTLFATPVDGGRRRVLTGTVNRRGDLTANVPMSRNTRFYAEFKGDPRYARREVSVLELSGLLPKVSVSGDYATSGKYHLYRVGDYVKLTGTLLPARVGRCLQFDSFRRKNGRWVADPSSGCFTTNRRGVARAYFHAAHPKLGVPYAIESFFAGDTEHCRSWSGFTYFEFTAAGSRSAAVRTSQKGVWTIDP